MKEENISSKTLKNMCWKFAERIGAQFISLVVQIILARLLCPSEFGIIALIEVFIAIFNTFITSGLGVSLIQKENADDLDFSSALIFNIAFSLILYLILYITAPLIASFYNNSQLTIIVRVLSIQLILSGIKTIQQAKISKKLEFKLFFKATLIGTILSGIIGIVMAYMGYGVWALVAQYLSNSTIDICILFISMKWIPKLYISYSRLNPLINYGWKILIASIVDTMYNEIRSVIIGKYYSAADLAYYSKGKQFPTLVCNNTVITMQSVLFPVMSIYQTDKEKLRNLLRRFIKTCSYIMSPLMVILAFDAKIIVKILLTEKWLDCVPYLQIYCLISALRPIQTANIQMIKAVGRSDITMYTEFIKKIFGIILIFSVMKFGVIWIALSNIIYSFVVLIINSYPAKKLINYSIKDQIFDFIPAIGLSIFVGICIYPITYCSLPNIVLLIITILLGSIIYILLSYIFKNESLYYAITLIKRMLKI